jgi:hypothetical protein
VPYSSLTGLTDGPIGAVLGGGRVGAGAVQA